MRSRSSIAFDLRTTAEALREVGTALRHLRLAIPGETTTLRAGAVELEALAERDCESAREAFQLIAAAQNDKGLLDAAEATHRILERLDEGDGATPRPDLPGGRIP